MRSFGIISAFEHRSFQYMKIYDLHTMENKESLGSPYCAAIGSLSDKAQGEGSKPFCTIALGSFDGVHLGHAALINAAIDDARKNGRVCAVWTFADDPGVLPEKLGMRSITTLPEKLSIFRSLGVDRVFLADFSDVRQLTPEEFVKKHLIEECKAKALVCGFNYTFGKNGMGDASTLSRLFENCIIVPPISKDGLPVSSSIIRRLLEQGDTESAAELLGRPFFLDSKVLHGKELGRTLGLPTINQDFPRGKLIPQHGIYASLVTIGGKKYVGASNIGIRPTVDRSDRVNCETHIIGFSGWLYGETIRVELFKRLRGEMKFSELSELKAQIERDSNAALDYFKGKQL